MPEKDQSIIFYVKERGSIFAGFYRCNEYGLTKGFTFRENLDDWWFDDETITHWMPLPPPPEEQC